MDAAKIQPLRCDREWVRWTYPSTHPGQWGLLLVAGVVAGLAWPGHARVLIAVALTNAAFMLWALRLRNERKLQEQDSVEPSPPSLACTPSPRRERQRGGAPQVPA